jgi:hypothetical protein
MIGILGTGAGGIMLGVWMLLPFIERRKPAIIG